MAVGIVILLVAVIGASFAYFTANISSGGNNSVEATTAVLASATMDYGDTIIGEEIYPGNKIIKTIHVVGSGPDNAVPITANLILTPDVTDFSNHIKYSIYAVEKSTITPSEICEESKPTNVGGAYYDAMTCNTSSLGTPILEGTFSGTEKVEKTIEVTSKTDTTYYLLIEYVNDTEKSQNEEQGKTFTINLGFDTANVVSPISYKYVVNGEETTSLPEKQDNYIVEVSCSDGVAREWNYETWSLNLEEVEENTTCTCSFKTKEPSNTMINYLTTLAETSEDLAYDRTVDNNLRYIGANPNNYVKFNDELWRIIGVMNNITDSEGNVGSHIKIIRNESLGVYSWDNKPNGVGSSTSDSGSNDWSDSTLMEVLNNGAYYNRVKGICPMGVYGDTIECDFSGNGLSSEAKQMISSVIWNLGGAQQNLTTDAIYIAEREENVYSGRPTKWIGEVSLMYPSDYGYAVGGNVRNTCLSVTQYNYYRNDCYINDWLYLSEVTQWFLTPQLNYDYRVLYLNARGSVNTIIPAVNEGANVRPTLYLNSNVEIAGSGDGSETNPFEFTIKKS